MAIWTTTLICSSLARIVSGLQRPPRRPIPGFDPKALCDFFVTNRAVGAPSLYASAKRSQFPSVVGLIDSLDPIGMDFSRPSCQAKAQIRIGDSFGAGKRLIRAPMKSNRWP